MCESEDSSRDFFNVFSFPSHEPPPYDSAVSVLMTIMYFIPLKMLFRL